RFPRSLPRPAAPAAAYRCLRAVEPGSWASASSGRPAVHRRSCHRCLPHLVALHLRQRLLEVLTLDNSFHRRSCDRRAFETGFRRTRFDRSGNDARGFTPRFAAQVQLQLILLPHGSREIAALLPSSTVRAFGGAPPPTMPSADFCATIRSPCDDPSPEGHGADLPR